MTAEATLLPPLSAAQPAPVRRRWAAPVGVVVAAGLLAVIAYYAQRGVGPTRITNPDVTGTPRPVRPLFGFKHWITLHEIGTILMMVTIVTVVVVGWRRHPRHPYLLMTIAATAIVWQDPIMNWAPYAVYNPDLWHWPVSWPLVSLSPTVEPFIVIGYASFYFGPFFPALWVLRRIQAKRPRGSFVWKHPLVTMAVLVYAIGFVFDAFLEIFLVRTGLYSYSHVLPFGSVFTGKAYQFPLLVESSLVTLVMIPAALLCYRDDTGRTQAEKLANKISAFRGRPALGTFAVMFAILNVAYFCYGGGFAIIRATKAATSVACPYPFPEARVYDPQGFYEKNGQPGPYFSGIWDGWESAQSGRPTVTPPAGGGRCGTATRG